jgi:ABC-type multidrug transport system fused ATPase/permease subunit
MIATVEADMNSVERVLYYSNNIESEAPLVTDEDPKVEWPSKGEIVIQHASMRYRDGPLVLKDLSLSIKGGEKIGKLLTAHAAMLFTVVIASNLFFFTLKLV